MSKVIKVCLPKGLMVKVIQLRDFPPIIVGETKDELERELRKIGETDTLLVESYRHSSEGTMRMMPSRDFFREIGFNYIVAERKTFDNYSSTAGAITGIINDARTRGNL